MEKTVKCIVELNLYKSSNGKQYTSDYDAILRWVINKVEKEEKQESCYNKNSIKYKDYSQREYDDLESYYDNI